MNVLIVDDNKIARTTATHLASQIKDITIVGECANAIEAYNIIQENAVDLILLDIEMPEISGLELIKNLGNKKPIIIFTTSKREYAVEAFEINVADYLLKPITLTRFISAIDKGRIMLESKQEKVNLGDDEFVFIRDATIVRRLKIDDILFAEAMGDYVKLHTIQKYYAIHSTLKAVEEKLPAANFLLVHRSFIVSVKKIDTIKDGLLVINGISVPVSDAYRAVLNHRMNIL